MRFEPPSARDVLGVPIVPPPVATAAATRLRAALARVHARSAPPALTVLERSFGLADTRALVVAAELGVPDRLGSGPRGARELAVDLDADADALDRLLRYLVSRDLLGVTRDGRYPNNAVSDVLRADHPASMRPWVLFIGSDWMWACWGHLGDAVRTGRAATHAALGTSFFEHTSRDAEAGDAFDAAMEAGSRLNAVLLRDACDLTGVEVVCDVGGGTGTVLATLLADAPTTRGVLLELASVCERARARLDAAGLADRIEVVAGDFFAAVPEGCDRYLLVSVLHDWGDDDAARILGAVRAVMRPRARVLVVEQVRAEHSLDDLANRSDLLMLALTDGGRERNRAELARCWSRSGLRLERTTVLASQFRVFELAPV